MPALACAAVFACRIRLCHRSFLSHAPLQHPRQQETGAENASSSAPHRSNSNRLFKNRFPSAGDKRAYLTGSLRKSRRPQSAQKSRTLLRLSLRESSSRGALRLLRSSRYALTRPDRFAAGASRSSGDLTASPQVHLAKRNRIARQAVRQMTDRLSEHRSQSCVCAHSSPPSLRQSNWPSRKPYVRQR